MYGSAYTNKSILEHYDTEPTTGSKNLVDSGAIKQYVDSSDALINAKVDDMISRVGNPFVFKGTVAALSNLPSSGNTINDTYFVEGEGFMYTWNGTSWDQTSTDVNDQLAHDIATEYNPQKTDYKAGDIVMYNNQVYVRNTDATSAEGSFVSANWTATSIGDELVYEITDLKSALDTATFNLIEWAPEIIIGKYIKFVDGTIGTSNTYARTNLWYGYGQRFAIELSSSTYEYVISYFDSTGNFSNGTGYLGHSEYASGLQYIPSKAIKFGVSFRRVDQNSLSDSDITAISTALKCYAATDTNLEKPGIAADAKATGERLGDLDRFVDEYRTKEKCFVKYYLQDEYTRSPDNSASNSNVFGIVKKGEYYTLKNSVPCNNSSSVRIKISGNVTSSYNITTINNWESGSPSFVIGHKYEISLTRVSSEGYLPYISVYPYGKHETVGNYISTSDLRARRFKATSENYNLCILIETGTIIDNVTYKITLQDLTALKEKYLEDAEFNGVESIKTNTSLLNTQSGRLVGIENAVTDKKAKEVIINFDYDQSGYNGVQIWHTNANVAEPDTGTNYKAIKSVNSSTGFELSSMESRLSYLPVSYYWFSGKIKMNSINENSGAIGYKITRGTTLLEEKISISSNTYENGTDFIFSGRININSEREHGIFNFFGNINGSGMLHDVMLSPLNIRDYVPSERHYETVSFPQEIYGGTYNVSTGVITATIDENGDELENPIEYTVDPIEYSMFADGNVFWTNIGKIKVTYYEYSSGEQLAGWDEVPLTYITTVYLDDALNGQQSINWDSIIRFPVFKGLKLKVWVSPGVHTKIMTNMYETLYSKKYNYTKNLTEQVEFVDITIPDGVRAIYVSSRIFRPRIFVTNLESYLNKVGFYDINLSDFLLIKHLNIRKGNRNALTGGISSDSDTVKAIGDEFFSPPGTKIVHVIKEFTPPVNYMTNCYVGSNYNDTSNLTFKKIFSMLDYSYHCYEIPYGKPCFWANIRKSGGYTVGSASYLKDKVIEQYIKFPSKVTNTMWANYIRNRSFSAADSNKRLFSIVHLTDIHGDMDSTHAAYEFADTVGIDCVAITGDCVPYGTTHGYSILQTLIENAKTPTVLSLGNHDVDNSRNWSDQEVYDFIIDPIKDTLQADDNHAYYYRDIQYDNHIVRLISLYPFNDNASSRWHGYYDQDQLDWFCDVLNDTPDNAHIIVLRHFSHNKPLPIQDKTMFYDSESSSNLDISGWLQLDADPIPLIVDAYNQRGTIQRTFVGQLDGSTENISISYDFTNRNNSEFVAYLTGHWHYDCIGYTRGTQTTQIELNSLCTIGYKGNDHYNSYTKTTQAREYGTDSQIAFNVFAIDFSNKKIYVARVGNGKTYATDLRSDTEKTWMVIDYPTFNN